MTGSLIEIIDRLNEVDDNDRYRSKSIFAEDGSDSLATARATVCPSDEEGNLNCPEDVSLSYVLTVQLAREAIDVWSEWRRGRIPSSLDKFEAVMHYSRNDAYLPVEGSE